MRYAEERGETVATQFVNWLKRFNYITIKEGKVEFTQYPGLKVWGALDYLKRHGFVIFNAMMLLLSTQPVAAAPMVDFSQGTTGIVGQKFTQQGVTVDNIFWGDLYRWDTSVYHHFDAGIGVIAPGERLNAAEPELNPGEMVRITSLVPMTGLWFTSVNNKANLDIYPSVYPAGFKLNVNGQSCHQRDRGQPQFSCYLALEDPSWVVWVAAGGPKFDNYSLVWGVDTATPEVPEPATLTLLGLGLLVLGKRVRG